jgi:hypothetical protein
MNDEIDVFGDAEPDLPEEGGLNRLSALYHRYARTDERIAEMKAELKILEADLRNIAEREFPDLFDEVGVTSFKVGNREVSLHEKLYGSIPSNPEDREAALEELGRHGGDKLLKSEVVVTWDKGHAQEAQKVQLELLDRGLPASLKENVHPMSLQAWAREQLEEGRDVNLDVLGLYNRRFVKVK